MTAPPGRGLFDSTTYAFSGGVLLAAPGGLFCSAPAPAPLDGLFGGAPAPAFGQAPAPAIGAPEAPAGPISTKQRKRKKKSNESKSTQRKKQRRNKKAGPALVVNNDVELPAPVQGKYALPGTTIESALPVESSTVELYDVLDHLLIMADKQDTVKDIVLSVAIHFDLLKVEKSMKELTDLIQGYVSATFKVS